MEVFWTAIVGELANRSISFLIDEYSKRATPNMEAQRLHDLQQLLLRVRAIIEEAEGRDITNRAMVHQLNILWKELYRGYFTMDRLRIQGNDAKQHDVSDTFSLSKYNPVKHLLFSTHDMLRNKELQQVIQVLKNIIVDASEFVSFLKNCPPLYRQPYSMHLFVGKCIFCRQMEMHRVMDFLMQQEHPSRERVGVLPIVGPGYVGKSTLVAHVCHATRVRNHFSQIVVVNGKYIRNQKITDLKYGGFIIHKKNPSCGDERLLVIIEYSEDVDEVAWNSFYSSSVGCLVRGSRIIVTGRSDTIIKFGTTKALVLNFLPLEAYWYLFKILIFGSADANDHPKLEPIAMEIARELNGSFIGANMNSGFLRNNLNAQYWCKYLTAFKANVQINVPLFGERPHNLVQNKKPANYRIRKDEYLTIYQHRTSLTDDNVPVITMYDVICGNVKCEGTFEVLSWKSHMLPYKSYIMRCRIQNAKLNKRKRSST